MTEPQISVEAVEAATLELDDATDYEMPSYPTVLAALAAAYPHLRQQWAREAEERLANFKTVMLFAPPFGNDYPVDAVPWTNVRVALDDKAWRINGMARGAQSGGQ